MRSRLRLPFCLIASQITEPRPFTSVNETPPGRPAFPGKAGDAEALGAVVEPKQPGFPRNQILILSTFNIESVIVARPRPLEEVTPWRILYVNIWISFVRTEHLFRSIKPSQYWFLSRSK